MLYLQFAFMTVLTWLNYFNRKEVKYCKLTCLFIPTICLFCLIPLEPGQVVRQIKEVPISSETARSLIHKLHLEECNINIENVTTQDIANHWLATDKIKDWKVLVEALLTERGCGCSVSGVLPLSKD